VPRHFKNWLKAYCQFTDASEAPLDFHFWTGVSTIAAALARKVWKDELLFKWTPNFYIIFVGPAGVVTKSTTLNIGYKLLAQVPNIYFGPDSMTWHGLAKDFERSVGYHPYKDKTGKDQMLLMSPLTCSISELGTFLRPDDSSLISFLTDVWDGKERPFQHTTAVSGNIKIENAWLNIIGATTPSWLQNNFPASLLGEGIGSRIIFVYGDRKRHLTAYPSQSPKAASHADTEKKLLEDLIEISKLIGEYDLTPDAYQWGTQWYGKHINMQNPSFASGRYSGYLARKQTHLHKLAMVLSASKRDALLIEKEDLEEAEVILSGTERSMIKVFENMGVVDEAKHIAELVNLVKAHKWLTAKELYRLCYNVMRERDFQTALKIAIEGNLLEIVTRSGVRGVSPKAHGIN
jgi:hypothetical protein